MDNRYKRTECKHKLHYAAIGLHEWALSKLEGTIPHKNPWTPGTYQFIVRSNGSFREGCFYATNVCRVGKVLHLLAKPCIPLRSTGKISSGRQDLNRVAVGRLPPGMTKWPDENVMQHIPTLEPQNY